MSEVTLTTARRAVIDVGPGPFVGLVHIEVESVIADQPPATRGDVARAMLNLTLEETRKLVDMLRAEIGRQGAT